MPKIFHNVKAQAHISVWQPLRLDALRVGVDVHLSLPVSNKNVDVIFSAVPMQKKGDYQYRLEIKADGKGITIHEVCAAVGFDEGASKEIAEIPVLKGAIEKVHIRHFSVMVSQSKDKRWNFTDWAVDVTLPSPIELIEKKLSMEGVELSAEKVNGSLTARGVALFHEEQSKQDMRVAFALPIKSMPGYFRVDSPNDSLTLEGLLKMFDLAPFQDVPVLTTLLKTKLTFFELSLQSTDKWHKVVGMKIRLALLSHDIGPLKLDALQVSASWTAAGQKEVVERASSDQSQGKKSHTHFTIGALLKDSGVATVLKYDSREHQLNAEITTQPGQSVRIADLLTHIVPDKDPTALDSVVGDVAIRGAKLVLDTKAMHVQAFVLKIVKGGAIQIPDGQSPTGLQLSSLTVHFDRKPVVSAPEPGKKPVVPAEPAHTGQPTQPTHPTQSSHPAQPVHPSPPSPNHDPPHDTTAHPPPSYSTEFGVDGLIQVGSSRMKCALTCTRSTGKEANTEISFTVVPVPAEAGSSPPSPISLTDLVTAFKIGPPDHDHPRELPPFDFGLENIHGKIRSAKGAGTGTGTKPTLSLTEFSLKVGTHKTLDLLAEPKVTIKDLYLTAKYPDAEKKLSGTVFGTVSIADKVDALLKFSRKNGVNEFRGSTVKKPANVTVSHVFSKFLNSEDLDMSVISAPPTSISLDKINFAVQPGEWYFISARGATQPPNTKPITKEFHNFDVQFRNLGAKIRVIKVKQDKTTTPSPHQGSKPLKPSKSYESQVFLCGSMAIPGFASADALLRIEPGKDSILTRSEEHTSELQSPA